MREALKGQLDQAKQASVQQALQDATQNATPAQRDADAEPEGVTGRYNRSPTPL